MGNLSRINFKDGLFSENSKDNDVISFSSEKIVTRLWSLESKKDKIVCYYKDNMEKHDLKYIIFKHGFYKVAIRTNDNRWITISKGMIKDLKQKFSGCLIISNNINKRLVIISVNNITKAL